MVSQMRIFPDTSTNGFDNNYLNKTDIPVPSMRLDYMCLNESCTSRCNIESTGGILGDRDLMRMLSVNVGNSRILW